MNHTHVRIFYPADPLGVVPGGIDTFLRGLVKWAPPEVQFSLVGMTTDPDARPVGQWTRGTIGERDLWFYGLLAVADPGRQSRIPLSLRYSAELLLNGHLREGFDLFDFHRPEPSLLFAMDGRPKNIFIHNDPRMIREPATDNRWKYLPALYESLERLAFKQFDSTWCVNERGVQELRARHPARAGTISFVPTWVDPEVFHPVEPSVRDFLRQRLVSQHELDPDAAWVVTVGRLDIQKDPRLMLAAFAQLCEEGRRLAWLVVGDGVLRQELQQEVRAAGLAAQVCFLGLLAPAEIADVLRAADVYALSSAYEGMPMALLEALGCGLPAAVTDVGEVRRVVQPGRNGAIAESRDASAFAAALRTTLDDALTLRGAPALEAVRDYHPATVLAPVYANYDALGREFSALRAGPDRPVALDRLSSPVVGVQVDLLEQAGVAERLLAWGRARRSSYVCFVNVHSAVLASYDARHLLALRRADMVAPDGAPIAWSLRAQGHLTQCRVDGPDMMWRLCARAAATGIPVGLYGSSPDTLHALTTRLLDAFPRLKINYVYSPPFRELSQAEDAKVCADINRSGIGLLFVALGCPRQEYWMARHRRRVRAVMLGVGAAFDFHAGTTQRAPPWMRRRGLEWLHRMSTQPGRLWRRYLFSNTVFVARTVRLLAASASRKLRPRTAEPLSR